MALFSTTTRSALSVQPRWTTVSAAPRAASNPIGFGLFLVVTATLFVRPTEFVPELLGLPVYQTLMIACLLVAFPSVARQLSARSLQTQPITVCVLGLLLAIMVSHLGHLELDRAGQSGWEFFKVVVYYLLLVGLLDSASRLRAFLGFFAVSVSVLTLVAVLQFQEVISIPTLTKLNDRGIDPLTGLTVLIPRLRSTGIFGDPNDLCLIIAATIPLACYWLTDRRCGPLRYLWLGPLALFGYALLLTQSRGGFLAFLSGVLAFLWARYGWKRAALLAAALLPVAVGLYAVRNADVERHETGLQRIQLWSDALIELRANPLFGIGHDRFAESAGLVAHNSYLHCFAELGLLGGVLFLGATWLALTRLSRLTRPGVQIHDLELQRLRPFLLALVAAYAGGMMTLTSSYMVPTYAILGLTVVFSNLAVCQVAVHAPRVDGRLAVRLAILGVVFLIVATVVVRVFVRW